MSTPTSSIPDRIMKGILIAAVAAVLLIGYGAWTAHDRSIEKKNALCAELTTTEAIQQREEVMDAIINQIWGVKELLIILDEHIKDPTTTPEELLEYTRSWREGMEIQNMGEDTLKQLRYDHNFIRDNCPAPVVDKEQN